jgi:SAM-dependent methyltransferase
VKVFNNFIKAIMIEQFSKKLGRGLSVLDLCCGRGGDIIKWKRQNINHYVGVDLSRALVEEAYTRYQELQSDERGGQTFKAIWIVNDAGDPQNLMDSIFKLDSKLRDIEERIVFDIVQT